MEIINKNNFGEKIQSGYVLVDFFAEWCGPCKMIGPVLEKASQEYKNVTFYKVDVDKDHDLSDKFGISSIPTVLLFKDGKKVASFNGFLPEAKIHSFIKNNAQ